MYTEKPLLNCAAVLEVYKADGHFPCAALHYIYVRHQTHMSAKNRQIVLCWPGNKKNKKNKKKIKKIKRVGHRKLEKGLKTSVSTKNCEIRNATLAEFLPARQGFNQ